MTVAQSLRTDGFLKSLELRGFTLTSDSGAFQALIAWQPSDLPQFDLGPGEMIHGVVHALREAPQFDLSDPPLALPTGIKEQSILTDNTGRVWRVLYIENNPVNIAILLYCQL